ncbi:unnamed protein product, partial [Phaeothamnion confervicola]
YALLALVCFWPFLVRGETYFDGNILGDFPAWYDGVHHTQNYDLVDSIAQVYPAESLFHDELRKGHWPLWNPYNMLGQPLYQGHGMYFYYPLTIILHALLPTHRVHDWMLVIHTILCGFGMTWFLRLQGRGLAASHLGGIAWAFSGPLATMSQFHQTQITFAWLPVFLGCISQAATQPTESRTSRGWLARGCLVGGLGVCAGPLNIAWICLSLGMLWCLTGETPGR